MSFLAAPLLAARVRLLRAWLLTCSFTVLEVVEVCIGWNFKLFFIIIKTELAPLIMSEERIHREHKRLTNELLRAISTQLTTLLTALLRACVLL